MKRPLRNALALASSDLTSRGIGFLVTVFMARVLGPSHFGIVQLGLAVLGYSALVANPGIQMLETRNVAWAIGYGNERVSVVLSLRLLLSAVLILTTAPFVVAFVQATEVRDSVVLFSLSLLPLALSLDWFFQGKEQFQIVSASRVVGSVVYGLTAFVLISTADDFRYAALAFLVGNLAASSFLLISYRMRHETLQPVWRPLLWRRLLSETVPVGLAGFLAQSAVSFAPLVIGILYSTSDVGMYSGAMKLVFLLLILDRTLNSLLLPVVARYHASRPAEVGEVVSRGLRIVALLVIPLSVCCAILAPELVGFVYGRGYEHAGDLLRILSAYFAFTMVNSVLVCALVGTRREKDYTKRMVTGSLILAIFVVALAVLYGPAGAASGVVLGELTILILLVSSVRRFMRVALIQSIGKPVFAGMAMVLCAMALAGWQPILVAPLSVAMYASVLLVTKGFDRRDMDLLNEKPE